MPRTFDGGNDNIHCSSGTLSAFTFGTLVAVIRRNSTAYNNIMTLHNSGGTSRSGIEIEDNGSGNHLQWQYDGNFVPSMFTVVNADGWALIAMGKGTGTTAVRCHKYVYSTNTWTHSDSNGTATNSTAPGASSTMRFGEWEGADDFNGDIAIAGAWLRNLTDAEVEQLSHSLQGWHALAPDALWMFDQQAIGQAVADLAGNGANQSSIAGTTVSASALPGLSYGHEVSVPHSAPSGGAANTDLTPAVLTLTSVATVAVPGTVSIALAPAVVTLTSVAMTAVPQAVSVTSTPGLLTLTAVAVLPIPLPVSISLTPSTVTLTSVPFSAVPQPVSQALTPAVLGITALAVVPAPGAVSVGLTPATLALTSVAVSPIPGAVSLGLVPATLSITAVPLSPGGGPISMDLTTGSLALQAEALSPVPGQVPIALAPGTLDLRAGIVLAIPGVVAVMLVPARIDFLALVVTPIGLSITNLVPGTLSFVAVTVSVASESEPFEPQPAIEVPVGPSPVRSGTNPTISVDITVRPIQIS